MCIRDRDHTIHIWKDESFVYLHVTKTNSGDVFKYQMTLGNSIHFDFSGGNGGNGAPSPSSNVTAKAPSPQTEQVRDIEAAEKMEAVKSGEASPEDVYAMFTK